MGEEENVVKTVAFFNLRDSQALFEIMLIPQHGYWNWLLYKTVSYTTILIRLLRTHTLVREK